MLLLFPMGPVSTSSPRSLSELGRSVKKQPTKSTLQRDQAQLMQHQAAKVGVVKRILHIPSLYPCFPSNATWVTCFLCYGPNFLSLLGTTLRLFSFEWDTVKLTKTTCHILPFELLLLPILLPKLSWISAQKLCRTPATWAQHLSGKGASINPFFYWSQIMER